MEQFSLWLTLLFLILTNFSVYRTLRDFKKRIEILERKEKL